MSSQTGSHLRVFDIEDSVTITYGNKGSKEAAMAAITYGINLGRNLWLLELKEIGKKVGDPISNAPPPSIGKSSS